MSAANTKSLDAPVSPQPFPTYASVSSQARKPGDLSFLWLEITRKCNLTCVHCYADSSPHVPLEGEMSFEDWAAVIVEAAQLGCREIQFIGGEPTLHPRLPDLISVASDQGFEFIEIFTNASRISEQLLDHFVRHHVRIATSFYSGSPEIHDLITLRKGSFNRTVTGIRRITEAGLEDVQLSYSCLKTATNWNPLPSC